MVAYSLKQTCFLCFFSSFYKLSFSVSSLPVVSVEGLTHLSFPHSVCIEVQTGVQSFIEVSVWERLKIIIPKLPVTCSLGPVFTIDTRQRQGDLCPHIHILTF